VIQFSEDSVEPTVQEGTDPSEIEGSLAAKEKAHEFVCFDAADYPRTQQLLSNPLTSQKIFERKLQKMRLKTKYLL